MSNTAVYLDYNASGLVRPQVIEAMAEALAAGGNPNAVHALGRKARARVETARAEVAELVGGDAASVVFSSGGTESNNQAIASAIKAGCERLIICATEHPCVSETAACCGVEVELIPVTDRGLIDLEWLKDRLENGPRAFVAVHHANNESGVIQPVAEAAALTHEHGGWMHVDAIQTAGKIVVDMAELGADTLTLSAHKLGGPQGVGALIYRDQAPVVRVIHGSGQERGLRAGTENVAGIVGFGVSARLAAQEVPYSAAHVGWRDAAEARVKALGATVIGEGAPRLPNTLFMAVPDWESPSQLMTLDLQGIMVSAGMACSSGKSKPSKAITAMGLHDVALGAIRVSGGWGTTEADWTRFADAWTSEYEKRRARRETAA
ncbi:cysteine desulfurase family protein [Brevundimonas sp. 2R-24]|uniref:Cysteine desulfurase n=1 Tax=Peiella sedimenti TaxID=3061083 RepID=A0ABT8SKW4_9CAUL|nr:cysteine desulfurase family protein [Caulobacteraceae bacterium XZ-24]